MSETNFRKAVGIRIRNLLYVNGKTLTELAKQIGMQRSNLSMVLRGDNTLMPEYGKKVAEFFKVSMDQLYDEREEIPFYLTIPQGMSREEVEPGVKRAIEEYLKQFQKGE